MNAELAEEIATCDMAIQFAWEWNMGYKQNFCCDIIRHDCLPDDWEAEELDFSSAMGNYIDDIRQYIVGRCLDSDGTTFEEEDIAKITKFVINPQETCVLALVNW